jgi:hypothetical protein
VRAEDFARFNDFKSDMGYAYDPPLLYNNGTSDLVMYYGGAGSCLSGTVTYTITPGDTMKACFWSEARYFPDWNDSIWIDYFQWKAFQVMDEDSYDAVMEDESHWYAGEYPMWPYESWQAGILGWDHDGAWDSTDGWYKSGLTHSQLQDSMRIIIRDVFMPDFWQALYDSNKADIPNVTVYQRLNDGDGTYWPIIRDQGAGILMWENTLSTFEYGGSGGVRTTQAWEIMDSIISLLSSGIQSQGRIR